jgi:anti-anti-sigma factor
MNYVYRYQNEVLTIDVDDQVAPFCDIDVNSFCNEIITLNTGGKNHITIDLIKKKHLNSTELGILIKIREKLFESGIDTSLVHPSTQILDLLAMVGLTDFFPIEKG